ncbi:hypothetical protein GCM10009422_01060 [Brevundimonas kwangchunensis]|uniref:Lipoprotein n=1 Tax=Brevundimonas kwangchunensis TaxID=322163 RepID=A0ABN1GEU2_9CAUL
MKSSVVFALLAFAPIVAGCSMVGQVTPGPQVVRADPADGQIEPIHAAAIAQDQAVFWVSSNGCTRKADLNPMVRTEGDGSIITLRRVKEDRCRNVHPEGVEFRWSFQELGLPSGARVSVENPYQLPAS